MCEYNGDSITELEWNAGEDEEQERQLKNDLNFNPCFICGEELDEDGHCPNGCDIED